MNKKKTKLLNKITENVTKTNIKKFNKNLKYELKYYTIITP